MLTLPRRHLEVSRPSKKKSGETQKDQIVVYVAQESQMPLSSKGKRITFTEAQFLTAEEIQFREAREGWLAEYLQQPVPVHRQWHNKTRDTDVTVSETPFGERSSGASYRDLSAADFPGKSKSVSGYPDRGLDPLDPRGGAGGLTGGYPSGLAARSSLSSSMALTTGDIEDVQKLEQLSRRPASKSRGRKPGKDDPEALTERAASLPAMGDAPGRSVKMTPSKIIRHG